MKTRLLITPLALLALSGSLVAAAPLGTAFTCQGRITDGGQPANGFHDFRLILYDAASGGDAVAGPITNRLVGVTNGLFTTTLDFGADAFTGDARWPEIGVRPQGSAGGFTPLSPRQLLTPAPYALHAGGVKATGITGTIAPANIGAGSITTLMLAAGAVGSNQLAAGAVTTAALADGAVSAAKIASVSTWFALTITNPTPAHGDSFGISAAAVGSDRVLIGAHWDDTGAENSGAAYLFSTGGALLTTFTNPTPAVSDYFGYSVAAVGSDLVLIGAYGDDTGATNAGAAYLFSTGGILLTTFTNPTPANSDWFGISVAAVGNDRVIIGAHWDDTGAENAGAAYLFSTGGTLLATFTSPTSANLDWIGISVAAVGTDRVLIGAYGDDTGGWNAGAAYLFRTNGTLLATFTNRTPTFGDFFGDAVAAVGNDLVLIGAYQDDIGATDAGAAYLYYTNGDYRQMFTKPIPAADDEFGRSVAAVGRDRVLVGAPFDDTGATDAGAAYLFDTGGTLLTTFANPTPAVDDRFGIAVAAFGSDRVLIGAYLDDTGAGNAGAACLFSTDGTLLMTFTNPIPAGSDQFGYAVAALGSDRVFIGAYSADWGLPDAGAAYLFTLESYTPGLIADGVNARSITTSQLEDGAVTLSKLAPTIGVWTRSGNDVYRLDGRVGVGTTTPSARLHAVASSGNALFGQCSSASASGVYGENNGQGFGIAGRTTGAGVAVLGDNVNPAGWAGYFAGNVFVSGTISPPSDRNVKQDFQPVDGVAVLEALSRMPLQTWAYTNNPSVRHLGPVAQDFHAAFGLGANEKSIATVDADGVALAAIQGLNQKAEDRWQRTEDRGQKLEEKLQHKHAEITELRNELAELKKIVSELSARPNPSRP